MTALFAIALAAMPHQGLPDDAIVVRGIVAAADCAATAQGLQTTYRVVVEERLRGSAPADVALTLPGGVLGGRRMALDEVPIWSIGDDVVATLLPDAPPPLWAQYTVRGERLEPQRQGGPTTVAELEEAVHSVHR